MQALLYIPWFKAEAWEIPLLVVDRDLPIQPFGVLVAIGVLLGAKVAERWGRNNDIAPAAVSDMIAHVVISAFVGAYFLNAAFYNPERLVQIWEDPSNIFRIYLGLSSYGGFIGAVLGLLLWWARRRASPIAIGEAACFGFPFGWVFGRLGCFVTHDHPGRITDFFLAVEGYRVGLPPYEPRHDLGLYEVFWALGVIGLFVWLAKKKRPRGFFMIALPLSYAPVRFFLDFLRAGPEDGGDVRYGLLTPGQYGSILILALGLFVWVWVRKAGEPEVPAHLRATERSYAKTSSATEAGSEPPQSPSCDEDDEPPSEDPDGGPDAA